MAKAFYSMFFNFFDRQFFDTLIFIVFGTGVVAAIIRLYQDFTRPLPPSDQPGMRSISADEPSLEDTQPRPPQR